jgi:DNA-binding beta-propeller fold protein YncE
LPALSLVAADFLRALIQAVPYKVHTVLTDNGIHFTDPTGGSWTPVEIEALIERKQPFRAHAFELACYQKSELYQINPKTNAITSTIPLHRSPRFLASGEGSIWVLTRGDGTVQRIDGQTGKLTATIETGGAGTLGDIATGGGYVWVSLPGTPVAQIDPKTNMLIRKFTGRAPSRTGPGNGACLLHDDQRGVQAPLPQQQIRMAIDPEVFTAQTIHSALGVPVVYVTGQGDPAML